MTNHHHERLVCECGIVVRSCRCMAPKVQKVVRPCSHGDKEAPAARSLLRTVCEALELQEIGRGAWEAPDGPWGECTIDDVDNRVLRDLMTCWLLTHIGAVEIHEEDTVKHEAGLGGIVVHAQSITSDLRGRGRGTLGLALAQAMGKALG